jgi:acyl-coenzyme A synthetase/AMP-(fatty) acid ligase
MYQPDNFDILIQSEYDYKKKDIKNFSELVFKKFTHRPENCDIIWSHDNEKIIKISLKHLRYIVSYLFEEFKRKKISPGDTVILADLLTNNVCLMSVMFTALASYGCRVMLPMWVETKEIETWIKITCCKAIIAPLSEVKNLKKHEREKYIVCEIEKAVKNMDIICYDIESDFKIKELLYNDVPDDLDFSNFSLVKKILKETDGTNEMAIFTTSGTSGRSKLIVYDQNAYINTISSYEASNLYSKDKMFGRVVIDIFPHSISIRSLTNALWTGIPVCMVNSDWIKNKPNKTVPILTEIKPEIITLGPSSFGLVLDFIKMFPELKETIFSNLKTIISTGATYSKQTANEWKIHTGLTLHNAYGLIETQQFTSTILNDSFNPLKPSLGKPFAGVKIGLEKFNKECYKLFVKTVFGHKYIINPTTGEHIYPDQYLDTKDIVKIDEEKNIYFVGRENLDFIKNGYGAKIPLSIMKNYYEELYKEVKHIEYFPTDVMTFYLGIAALIFIREKNVSKGRVTNKHIIKKYKKIIEKINKELITKIEPFEYENRTITRFLLINCDVPKTCKNTISKYKIEANFKGEIFDLKKSNSKKSGIENVLKVSQKLLHFTFKIIPLKNNIFRKFLLKII